MLYQFIDEKDCMDVPELKLMASYVGLKDDEQLVNIYDKDTRVFIGTYCVERFFKEKVKSSFLNIFNYETRRGIQWFVTSKHDQAYRLYQRFLGRKCDVRLVQSRSRSLILIYQ